MQLTRIYKYAMVPTPMQTAALEEVGVKSRVLWNRLVSETKWAIHECENGRRANIANTYTQILKSKKMTGQRSVQVKKLVQEKSISAEDALNKIVSDKSSKDIAIALRKNGTRYLRFSNKHLARLYATEYVNRLQSNILTNGTSAVWYSIARKWDHFCKSWENGTFDAPRFKKRGQISAIQKQITRAFNMGEHVDLTWCGSPCLEKIKVIYDRPIPAVGVVKQIALTKSPTNKWFVCVFVSADKSVFERVFTSTGQTVGIDPGFKSAMTTSDGNIIQPKGLSKQSKPERKLKRLQRRLSRLTTQYNPHCFNLDGTWKRGQRLIVKSKSMAEVALGIAEIKEYFKDAKADYYHNAAIKLLNQYDVIGVGNAKIHNLVLGKGNAKRAMNTRAREHAISDFVSKLKDKASLSLTPKQIFDKVSEVNTTRKCSHCGELTGPTGIAELHVRNWICSKCNTAHDRDVNAALNIRSNTISLLTAVSNTVSSTKGTVIAMKTVINNNKISEKEAAAAQSVSGEKSPKVRRSTKVPKKQRPRSTEITNLQSGGPMLIPVASVQVVAQVNTDVRISKVPVTEHITKVMSFVDSASPSEMMEHSQCQENNLITQEVTQGNSQSL